MDVLRELERGPAAGILVRCLVDYMWMAPVFSLLYLLAVFGGRRWMQNRKPYVLRKQLVVWNTALALFSIVGFTRVMPLMIKKWSQVGRAPPSYTTAHTSHIYTSQSTIMMS